MGKSADNTSTGYVNGWAEFEVCVNVQLLDHIVFNAGVDQNWNFTSRGTHPDANRNPESSNQSDSRVVPAMTVLDFWASNLEGCVKTTYVVHGYT
ncbi:MAG: hypothetical protein BWX66_01208 [Deltaproteobacteria bacterium ADurb.Bin058]|nr:MAG: hypothetical protein BWX66_01208 [Deltaproteobacteria bacterium ADurb.Bin058]